MRKLTREERAAKYALAHTHDENCGHAEAPAVAPVAEEAPAEEADGNGWCVELSNGSTTYRFTQSDHATEFIQNNAGMLVALQEGVIA